MNLELLTTKVYAAAVPSTPIKTLSVEITSIGQLVNIVTNVIIIVGIAVVLVMLAVGFLRYVTSQGDKAQVEGAQKTLTYAVIGGIGLLLVFAIRQIIFDLLGVDKTQLDIVE